MQIQRINTKIPVSYNHLSKQTLSNQPPVVSSNSWDTNQNNNTQIAFTSKHVLYYMYTACKCLIMLLSCRIFSNSNMCNVCCSKGRPANNP